MDVQIEVERNGVTLKPHWYGPAAKPDRFGKRGGYRVTPPGKEHNFSAQGVYYKTLKEVAQHLRENPDWGLRFTVGTTGNTFVKGIMIDGELR